MSSVNWSGFPTSVDADNFQAVGLVSGVNSQINLGSAIDLKIAGAGGNVASAFQLAPQLIFKWYDDNNNPASGWLVNTYIAGTTTRTDTYENDTGTTVNDNPIVLDARGEARIYLSSQVVYKFVITDALGGNVAEFDNITGVGGVSTGGGVSPVGELGDLQLNLDNVNLGASGLNWKNDILTIDNGGNGSVVTDFSDVSKVVRTTTYDTSYIAETTQANLIQSFQSHGTGSYVFKDFSTTGINDTDWFNEGNVTSSCLKVIDDDEAQLELNFTDSSTMAYTSKITVKAEEDNSYINIFGGSSTIQINANNTNQKILFNQVNLSSDDFARLENGIVVSSNSLTLENGSVDYASGLFRFQENGVTRGFNATSITYDNTSSGLTAVEVQSAIDEIVSSVATPAGANTQIQFNNSGAFGASANLTWNGTILTASNLRSDNIGSSSGDGLIQRVGVNHIGLENGLTRIYNDIIFEKDIALNSASVDILFNGGVIKPQVSQGEYIKVSNGLFEIDGGINGLNILSDVSISSGDLDVTGSGSFDGDVNARGSRFTGLYDTSGATGDGLEIEVTGGASRILSYNRSTSQRIPLNIDAKAVNLVHDGSAKLSTTSTGIDVSGDLDVTGSVSTDDVVTLTTAVSSGSVGNNSFFRDSGRSNKLSYKGITGTITTIEP